MIVHENNESYDVVVIGAGPAGTTAATFLQNAGHRCLVLDKATFPRYHVGESLIPHTFGTLDRLGILPKLNASHFPQKHSVRFVSPHGNQSDPFYFSETVEGSRAQTWQVVRSEFDQICLDNAIENGVETKMNTKVQQVLFQDGRAVGVRVQQGDEKPHEISAQVVIDASGSATLMGSQLGLKQHVPGLKKAAIWSYYKNGKRLEGLDAGETTIFMIPKRGWFWYIPLPDNVVSVGLVANPDDLFHAGDNVEQVYLDHVEHCGPLKDRLNQASLDSPIRYIPTLAYRNRHTVGDGWIMIGDAAAFLDPIYSSGLFLALASAELAAYAIHEALLQQDLSAKKIGTFITPLAIGLDVIHRLIHAFYDPDFSFRKFVETFPQHRPALIDCLVGDVLFKNMTTFTNDLAQLTPPPPSLD